MIIESSISLGLRKCSEKGIEKQRLKNRNKGLSFSLKTKTTILVLDIYNKLK